MFDGWISAGEFNKWKTHNYTENNRWAFISMCRSIKIEFSCFHLRKHLYFISIARSLAMIHIFFRHLHVTNHGKCGKICINIDGTQKKYSERHSDNNAMCSHMSACNKSIHHLFIRFVSFTSFVAILLPFDYGMMAHKRRQNRFLD